MAVQGDDSVLHYDIKYQRFYEALPFIKGGFYFEETPREVFVLVDRYLKNVVFCGKSDILANMITAYLITTDNLKYIQRHILPVVDFAEIKPLRTLILQTLDSYPSTTPSYRADADVVGYVTCPSYSNSERELFCVLPDYYPRNNEDFLKERSSSRIVQGIYVESLDKTEVGTIAAMSFVARELQNKTDEKSFLEKFDYKFGPEYYAAAVYTATIITGSTCFMRELFDTQDSIFYCLVPIAMVGIGIHWSYNFGFFKLSKREIKYPEHLFDETILLSTLQTLHEMDFDRKVIAVMLEHSDLEKRSTEFREQAIILWIHSMTDERPMWLIPTFSHDEMLLKKTVDYALTTGKIDGVKLEKIYARAFTREAEINRVILIIMMIRNPRVPIRALYQCSLPKNLLVCTRIWEYLEQMKDKQGRLLSSSTFAVYCARMLILTDNHISIREVLRYSLEKRIIQVPADYGEEILPDGLNYLFDHTW